MTRFELAAYLNSSLGRLDEEERHRIIDRHIADVNRAMAEGASEADAVAALGDLQTIVNVVLARNHAGAPQQNTEFFPQDENEENKDKTENAKDFVKKILHRNKTEKRNKITDTLSEKRRKAAEAVSNLTGSAEEAVMTTAHTAGEAIKKTADKSKGMLTGMFSFAADMSFSLISRTLFVLLWIPCMLITVMGVTATVTLITLYIFSGIGFLGVCVAGIGCCIMGVAFTVWLGIILTGGKRKCEN